MGVVTWCLSANHSSPHSGPILSSGDKSQIKHQGRGQNEGQTQPTKIKNSELQILIILLLVTFGFLMLTTPAYAFFLYINVADYEATPKIYAGYRVSTISSG